MHVHATQVLYHAVPGAHAGWVGAEDARGPSRDAEPVLDRHGEESRALNITEVRISGSGSAPDSPRDLYALERGQAPRERAGGGRSGARAGRVVGLGGGVEGDGEGEREPASVRSDVSPGMVAVARWAESVCPFGILLLCVFIYEHSKGLFVFVWLSIFLSQVHCKPDAVGKLSGWVST